MIINIMIKMKPVDVKSNTHINSSEETNDKKPKFKIGYTLRISRYKNICAKCYTSNWSEEVFVIKKLLCRGHMLLVILKAIKLLDCFTKNNCKKQIKKSLEFKK